MSPGTACVTRDSVMPYEDEISSILGLAVVLSLCMPVLLPYF